ncbi:lysozyme [Vibrio methylphosphonaticus]|uniref:lysozyme n=1 Tax=Vibrio methylphosphonaticus TaxID=2946866 RepID=UPI00202A1082|nr:lysozyme [Vibrio methylphosphonaticus]MCL9775708.1 lysozyme [Vibrio methylphosphonaticus]
MKLAKKIVCSVGVVIALITGGATLGTHSVAPTGQIVIANEALGELRISPKGLAIVGNMEGCRLDPYTCPSGLTTNGIGNTHDVPDLIITMNQVAKDWVKNLQGAERCIARAEKQSGVALSQGQFDAFVSFAFNTGCPRFERNRNGTKTRIYSHLLASRYEQACNQLPRWVYGAGKKLPGLVKRRRAEHARCMEVD